MQNEIDILRDVSEKLNSAGIAFMLTGSVAMSYYATPRMTRDIDIVVEVSRGDVDRLSGLFHEDFYIEPEAVDRAITGQLMFNAIHTALIVKVDFIVRKDSEYRREEFRRRRRAIIDGVATFVVAPEDLIISKLDWARDTRSEVQLADVRNLLDAVPDLDREYLTRWVGRLGLDGLYREVSG